MTVNTTTKTSKTAKNAEALTMIGVRLSKYELEAVSRQAEATGRSKSDVLRTCIQSGLMVAPKGMDIVALDIATVGKFMSVIKSCDSLGHRLERLMQQEIDRKSYADGLAALRAKIKTFRVEDIGGGVQ